MRVVKSWDIMSESSEDRESMLRDGDSDTCNKESNCESEENANNVNVDVVDIKDDIAEARARHIERIKEQCVKVVVSQTTWSEDEARTQLEANNYNVKACIRIFMGMPPVKAGEKEPVSVNQGIFTEIRTLMDTASAAYERKKQYQERLAIMQQQMQARRAEMQNQVQSQETGTGPCETDSQTETEETTSE